MQLWRCSHPSRALSYIPSPWLLFEETSFSMHGTLDQLLWRLPPLQMWTSRRHLRRQPEPRKACALCQIVYAYYMTGGPSSRSWRTLLTPLSPSYSLTLAMAASLPSYPTCLLAGVRHPHWRVVPFDASVEQPPLVISPWAFDPLHALSVVSRRQPRRPWSAT